MAKKKSEAPSLTLCAHCCERFDFNVKWCKCCQTHMHPMFLGKEEDCVYCVSGLTREGEKKYGPFKSP